MESKERNNNDLEQYIVLDGITICLENMSKDMEEQNKQFKSLRRLINLQFLIIAILLLTLIITR